MKLERFIGPLPGENEARAFGVCGIAIALIACGLSLYFGFKGETFLGRPLGSDFVQFYAAGRILNLGEPAKLFDVPFLADMEHASLPTMPETQMLIFGNAPCIAAIFRPLALLSYEKAYCVWLVISAAIYLSGLLILLRGNRIALLLALSTPMFTLETWIGGQVSVFAFFAFAVCVRWFEEERYFLAGLILGLASYKPSLVAIPAAVFLIGRCWEMLAGLSVSVGLVTAASFATVGLGGMELWLRTLRVFRYLATDQESILRRSKYVDVNSFLTGLLGPNKITIAASLLTVTLALAALAWTWLRAGPDKRILWAGTIASILVLNVYVPVYDTIILIPALVLVAKTIKPRELQIWLLLFCLVPWLTQSAADFLRIQILTIVIAAFSYRIIRLSYGHPRRFPQ
jgi:alpha-1,2-mannosyltransferase